MTDESQLVAYLRKVTTDLQQTRAHLREVEGRGSEPIAVVGIGCRYPGGVRSAEDLWRVAAEGRDVITGFPTDRGWDVANLYDPDPEAVGRSYTREGGFLTDIDRFDAEFFGLSPLEATTMDPQQRLLLETTWEALEHGGIVPGALRGSRTGVFTGVMHHDYGGRFPRAPEGFEGYLHTGSAGSMAVGRVSYLLGLEGPAVTVDTACSSSLVALHLACQALRNGECELALAGGVAVMATPTFFVEYSRQRVLSADGRCRSFSDDGAGTGWSEGVGVLVVERLSQARRLGHRVLAVVRGSAVNQDGASNGMTAPNGPAQQRVIQAALRSAQLSASEVDLLEAHGTGTRLGDPIEAQALQATYGQAHSPDRPLHLGSLKSNLGHAQAAAGVAGVIKAIQAMRHRTLPPTLHAERPSTEVDWTPGTLHLLTRSQPWEPGAPPRRAGVSSFGMSGTNAHLLVEEADPAPNATPPAPSWAKIGVPLVLSAKTPEAVRAQASALHEHLTRHPDEPLHHTARTLAQHRTQHAHRTALTGTRTELLTQLTQPTTTHAVPTKVTALYSGQGTQHPAMGRQLARHFPVYADAWREAAAHLNPHLPQPLDTLSADPHPTHHAQPLLFAHQFALTRLYQAHGLTPTTLIGHSLGEITAATIAGVLTPQDAARLIATRARLMHQLPGRGAMFAVQATEDEITTALASADADQVSIAAVNGPSAVVLSGTEQRVAQLEDLWRGRGRRTTRLRVSHAFHSPLMEPLLDEFAAVLEELTFREPTLPYVPTAASPHPVTSPAYWLDQVRRTVRFHDALRQLPEDALLLEIGPDAALTPLVTTGHTTLASAQRERDEVGSFLQSLADAHAHGASVDWSALFPPTPTAPPAELPTYPFQRERYWIDSTPAEGVGSDAVDHPFLTGAMELPAGQGLVLSGRLSPSTQPWLADHAVAGTVLLPGTGFLELAWAAARRAGCDHLGELVVQAPLLLPATGSEVQVWVAAPGQDVRNLVIRARDGDGEWRVHATGTLAAAGSASPATDTSWAAGPWPPAKAEEVPVEELYEELDARGYAYGPAFRCLRAVWRSGQELYAEVVLTDECRDARLGVHPALLDAALHPLALTADASDEVRLPFAFGPTTVHSPGARALRVRLRTSADAVQLDAVSAAGEPVLTSEGLVLRTVDTGRLAAPTHARVDRLRHEITWQRVADGPSTEPAAGTWLVLNTASAAPSWDAVPVEDAVTLAFDGEEGRAQLAVRLPQRRFAGVLCFARRPEELLTALQAVADAGIAAPVWCVTHRADDDPDAAAVGGLARAAALELPDRWGGLVDVPEERTDTAAARLGGLLAGGDEDQVRITADGVFARRLTAVGTAEPTGTSDEWAPSGTVLITGGTGALGAHVARWVAQLGGCSLVLASRQGPAAPGATELLAELTAGGIPARIVAVDVADREAVAALVQEAEEAGAPVRAVFHAAGSSAEQPLLETAPAELRSVLTAKVEGARVLDEVLAEVELDAFVLFSSISGTWGAAGQAAYGAANAALDAVAAGRRARGLAATSLAWGPWAGGGMVDAERERQLRRRGLVPLPVLDAVPALARAVALGGDAVLVDVAWSRFLPLFTAARPAPLFEAFLREPAAQTAQPAGTERFVHLPPVERGRALQELVRSEVAAAVGQSDPGRIALERPLGELGFDSLMSVRLRDRLAAATGVRLSATLAFDHPTSTALVRHLESLLAPAPDEAAQPAAATVAATAEPVAIVGMACRYPGGITTPEDLWRLVAEGRDAVTGFPTNRGWDLTGLYDPGRERTGTTYAREGGFLDDPAGFDADFFGIPPREALAMDPQQRLLLETAWEAVESAGIVPETLRGTRAGVFAGVMYNDYYSRLNGIPDGLEGILGLANSNSVMSGRISYLLGLEGPAVTVDTACSSSLVALHLACQALRNGECDTALAGGATVMATPNIFVEFSRQGGLARDGRCKAFSAEADGTGWSEGVGALLLERLSDARRLGHHVLAVVRGSAVNQDGASNGMTAPNGPAQQRVIHAALHHAQLSPAEVDLLEAHGTGTRLGDPIEAQALQATYGQAHSADRPLHLGSLKSNLGHTQAAAGIAGLIKAVQALRHHTLPPTLHTNQPTPEVDWTPGTLRLLTQPHPWPRTTTPRHAAVSSFGISGTNAHVLLEEGDPPPEHPSTPPAWGEVAVPFVLSSRTPGALAAQARALRAHLTAHPEFSAPEVARSLATTRSASAHRAAVVAADRQQLLDALDGLGAGPDAVTPASVRTGTVRGGRTVLMFPGQGSQWLGMGRELLAESEVFAAAIRECEEALAPFVAWSLREVLTDTDAASAPVDVVQPALFAVMVSLARMWQDWGVPVDAVVGHSQGEVAAACVSGALSLADGARVVATRSRLLAELAGTGGMVFVGLPVDEVRHRLDDRLSIASVNGPGSVVVSGPDEALDALLVSARADGVHVRRVEVDYASHSSAVEAVRERLLAELAPVTPHDSTVPLYSTVTGTQLSGSELDAEYWYRNLRETVQLETSLKALASDGFGFFVECSPHPVLTVGVRETLDALGTEGAVLGSLRREDGGLERMVRSLAEGYVEGLPVDWHRVLGAGRTVPLPTYAFQHERFWLDAPEPAAATGAFGADARFWDAVERADLEELAAEIGPAEGLAEALPALAAWRRRSRRQEELDAWRYEVVWRAQPIAAERPQGRWLLLTSGTPEAERLQTLLADAELACTPLVLDADDADRSVLADRLKKAAVGELAGVLSLLGLDERPHPSLPGLTTGLALTVAAVQALGDAGCHAPLWAVTCGATGVDEAPLHPGQHQVWGLGRVAALEHSARWGGLVDLPAEPDGPAAAALLGILAGSDADRPDDQAEDQWAVRDTGTHVRRLVRAAPHQGREPWRPAGTVLITGAGGSLGPHLARSMAERGAPHVALVSRRGTDSPGLPELLDELRELGCSAQAYACDVRDREGLRAVLQDLADAGRPVTTALHAAAHLDIAALEATTLDHFAEIVDAKVAGARHLAELLDPEHLRELVLFSSIAGVWGSADHGAYAAGNAFLDAYAARCRAEGLPVTSVAWGIWDEQITKERTDADLVVRRGLPFLDRTTAFEGLYQAMATDRPCHIVAEVNWSRFIPVFTSVRPSPLLADLAETAGAPQAPDAPEVVEDGLRARLAGMSPADRERTVLDLVRRTGAVVLGRRPDELLPAEREFRQAGFDSLLSVDLRNRLNHATGLALPPTLLFDHTTPARLTAHLLGELSDPQDATAENVLTRIDRIGTEVDALSPEDEAVRRQLTSRLERLLRTLRPDAVDDPGAAGDLEAAEGTAELLDLLDTRYGES